MPPARAEINPCFAAGTARAVLETGCGRGRVAGSRFGASAAEFGRPPAGSRRFTDADRRYYICLRALRPGSCAACAPSEMSGTAHGAVIRRSFLGTTFRGMTEFPGNRFEAAGRLLVRFGWKFPSTLAHDSYIEPKSVHSSHSASVLYARGEMTRNRSVDLANSVSAIHDVGSQYLAEVVPHFGQGSDIRDRRRRRWDSRIHVGRRESLRAIATRSDLAALDGDAVVHFECGFRQRRPGHHHSSKTSRIWRRSRLAGRPSRHLECLPETPPQPFRGWGRGASRHDVLGTGWNFHFRGGGMTISCPQPGARSSSSSESQRAVFRSRSALGLAPESKRPSSAAESQSSLYSCISSDQDYMRSRTKSDPRPTWLLGARRGQN